MNQGRLILSFALFLSVFVLIRASEGDSDPIYKTCVEQCQKTGCVGEKCFPHCKFSSDGVPIDGPWYLQEPLYQRWKQWDCQSDCRYQCMLSRETEREKQGYKPVKYHGKWPFHCVYGIQEPVSVAFAALNLAIQFHGWVSFFILVNYNLALRPNRKTYYGYTGLMHLYGLFAMNSWLWSAVYRSRDVELTERLHHSSAAALLGYSIILAIFRTFNVTIEAARVMISAPLIAYVTTHILYLNFYQPDYDLNRKVCMGMSIIMLFIWTIWASSSRHPSRWKLWVIVIGGAVAMLIDTYDFAPYWGFVDAHALYHASTIPLTFLWWSFIRDDAEYQTLELTKKKK